VSDENVSGTPVSSTTPGPDGAYDWLFESHQQSAPMAPLTDDVPAPAPAGPTFLLFDPAAPPASATAFPDLFAPVPAAPTIVAAPVFAEPVAPVQPATLPLAQPPVAQPGAFTFASAAGPSAFTLERRHSTARWGNGPLDWIAFVLAFLAPPIGLLAGIGAVIVDSRTKGYAAGIAKAAIGIGAALSIVLGVAFVVVSKINSDQAAHASIVASSRAWCAKLDSNPATLSSDTFGWPSPGDTIPSSIAAMTSFEAYWDGLAKLAPAGIRADTQKVADAAKSIVGAVQSTQTLNDAGNIAQLQNVVATSGIHGWVSNYCN
jgi:hypothetical protein